MKIKQFISRLTRSKTIEYLTLKEKYFFRMSKLFNCDVCGKSYKNSRSLSTHKYSYHSDDHSHDVREKPYTQHGNYSISSSLPSIRGSGDNVIQYPKTTSDSDDCSLQKIRTDNLKEKVFDLQFNAKGTDRKLNDIQRSLEELDYLVKTNQSNVGNLRQMIDHNYATEDKEIDLKARDLLDDVIEVEALVSESKVRQVIDDIPKVRQVMKYIMEDMDLSNISEEEINFLTEISTLSKAEARVFISDNFSELASIFKDLKPEFEQLLQSENGDTESEDMENYDKSDSENAAGSQQSRIIERSDSDTESDSENEESSDDESGDDDENSDKISVEGSDN